MIAGGVNTCQNQAWLGLDEFGRTRAEAITAVKGAGRSGQVGSTSEKFGLQHPIGYSIKKGSKQKAHLGNKMESKR